MGLLPLLREDLSLPDPEPVLFIRDDQGQPVILHSILNQGMGPDDNIILMVFNPLIDFSLFFCLCRACEQCRRHAERSKKFLESLVVLACKYFRRSHQNALIPGLRAHQKKDHRKDRLP